MFSFFLVIALNQKFAGEFLSILSETLHISGSIEHLENISFLFEGVFIRVNAQSHDNFRLFFFSQVNFAVDGEFVQNLFACDGSDIIKSCFDAILIQNQGKDIMCALDFREMAGELVRWPSNAGFGNAMKYVWEQNRDNVKTNITTHAEKRLCMYFKMCVFEFNDHATRFNYFNDLFGHHDALPYFDDIDIRNAVDYTYHRKDSTGDDVDRQMRLSDLLDELRIMGAPNDCNIRDFVKNNWFASMRMWIEIQRDIHRFHITYKGRPDKPNGIKSFVVVPMCTFQRRHIRIDTDVLYRILCSTDLVPKRLHGRQKKNATEPRMCNISFDQFTQLNSGLDSWNLFFDMDKINQYVHGKKTCHKQILSDGVSASIVYDKPKQEASEVSDEALIAHYGNFVYELGIDMGMRTWNATVRRDILTEEEVSNEPEYT